MKQKLINFIKHLNKKNVASTIISIIALVNQALTLCGKGVLPIDNATVETIVSLVFTIGSNLYLAWTNFNTSEGAQKTQAVLDLVKVGVITIEQVEEFVEQSKKVQGIVGQVKE